MKAASRTKSGAVANRADRRHEVRPTLHWDGARLVPRGEIRALCEQLGRKFQPERIVLFGSYAYGQPNPHSDVDLMVVTPLRRGERPLQRAHRIRQHLEVPFALDLVVRTPQFIAERLEERDVFIQQVMSQGVVMYESQHS